MSKSEIIYGKAIKLFCYEDISESDYRILSNQSVVAALCFMSELECEKEKVINKIKNN